MTVKWVRILVTKKALEEHNRTGKRLITSRDIL